MTQPQVRYRTVASVLVIALATSSAGCAGGEKGDSWGDENVEAWEDPTAIGQATLEIRQVPATGVSCIRISVAGDTTVSKDFGNLAANAATTNLNMDRLPMGKVTVTAMAYAASTSATACNTSAAPTYIADTTTALLEPGIVSSLALTFHKNNPVNVTAEFVGNIQALAGGHYHTLLLVDGQVYQWGAPTPAQTITKPTLVSNLSGVVSIDAGDDASCAVKDDGSLWCWGDNSNLGVTSTTPTQLHAGFTHTKVIVGQGGLCALAGDVSYCWGTGTALGATQAPTVTSPMTISGVFDAALGASHICYIASSFRRLACKGGQNSWGQLGRPTDSVLITSFGGTVPDSPFIRAALGWEYTLALKADGTVWAGGYNTNGQLGRGNTQSDSNTAAALKAIPGLANVKAIATGDVHSLALREDGVLFAWGANQDGMLGDASQTSRSSPVIVKELPPARLIAAGAAHSCAVTGDERLYCWGRNSKGALGTGDLASSSVPMPAIMP